jgi:hypothetical protein
VVKHVDAAVLRVDVAAVLAVAADAVLVAQLLLKFGANLVTALARLHVSNLTRRSSLEAGRKREKKGGEERTNEIFASATSQWQIAKASAATLSQQEKNGTADVKLGRAHISGFIDTVAS